MYKEKINQLIRVISETPDSECVDLMEELVLSASNYIRKVNVLEIGIMVGRYDKGGDEYKKYIEKLDKQRSSAHNTLKVNVKIINRLCRNNNLPVIYEGNEEDGEAIEEFAKDVVDEFFGARKLLS